MNDIISQLKGVVSSGLLSEISKSTGESEQGVSKALDGIFPLLLGGILKKAGEPNAAGGMGELLGLLKNFAMPGAASGDSSGLLSVLSGKGGEQGGMVEKFISLILGNKSQDVVGFLSNLAGIKGASASSILNMAGLVVMQFLGKKTQGGNLSLNGLMSYLALQKDSIIKAAPAGLGGVLGLTNLEQLGGKWVDEAIAGGAQVAAKSKSFLVPIIAFLALLLGALFLLKNCATKEAPVVEAPAISLPKVVAPKPVAELPKVIAETSAEVVDAGKTLWANLGSFFKIVLPGGIELNIPEFGVENKLLSFIKDDSKLVDSVTWFSFDRLLFETGSSVLKPDSNEQLHNIAEIMKAYPETGFKIGGYTDSTGDVQGNLKLSQDRADSVRKQLVTLGVPESRLAAEGYGEEHPVASNSTPEGREQNRRIDILVTKK